VRLVVDVRLINSSGIGTYIKNVLPDLIDFFREVIVLGNKEELLGFEWSNKVTIINVTFTIYSFLEQLYYPFIIPECDIFWSPHFNTPLLSIKSKKRIVTIHDVNHLSNPSYYNLLKRLWAKCLYKNAVKKSDCIITVSEFSKLEILKYFKTEELKINIVHCGVSENFGVSKVVISNEIVLPNSYLLYVGNVKPHKNLITLLKAYNELEKSIKEKYKLVIMGKKEGFITNDRNVFDFIENHNLERYIYFTGHVKDEEVPFIYEKATLLVFPSLYEGFGLPLLEAMSCQIPVLSSDRASLPEVGGEAALYFNPLDPVELKEKIVLLMNDEDLKSKMIEKGNKRVQIFNWEQSIQEHLRIFKNTIHNVIR